MAGLEVKRGREDRTKIMFGDMDVNEVFSIEGGSYCIKIDEEAEALNTYVMTKEKAVRLLLDEICFPVKRATLIIEE